MKNASVMGRFFLFSILDFYSISNQGLTIAVLSAISERWLNSLVLLLYL